MATDPKSKPDIEPESESVVDHDEDSVVDPDLEPYDETVEKPTGGSENFIPPEEL